MNKFLCFLFVAVTALQTAAQNLQPYDLIPYRKDTLWGFADTTKKIVIAPKYNEVKFFDDAITAVRKGGKWAFIDRSGKELTAYKYDAVGSFSEGMVQVRANNKVGYVSNKGKEVVAPQYTFCEEFSEGLGIVRDSVNGKLLSGAIDKTGKLVIPKNFNLVTSKFSSGLAAIDENDHFGFIDKTGKKLKLPENVEPYLEFSEGVAMVKVRKVSTYTNAKRETVSDTGFYLGLLNAQGKLVTDSVSNGSVRLRLNKDYSVAANFSNGFAVIQHKFTDYNWFSNTFENNEYAFLDKSGKLSKWYASVRLFGPDKLAMATVKGDYSASIVDAQFNIVKSGLSVYDAGLFSEGLLRVKKSQYGKWSYIDRNGNSPLNYEYEEVSDFYRGIAVVKLAGRTGCVDKKGNRFWE